MSSLFSQYTRLKESGLFDEAYYRKENPEVEERNLDPLVHYLEKGAREQRNPSAKFDARGYVRVCRERGEYVENPLLHYLETIGKSDGDVPEGSNLPAQVLARGELLLNIDRLSLKHGDETRTLSGVGWCLADSTITELRVSVGTRVTRLRYGIQRADVALRYPKVAQSDLSGFEFDLALTSEQYSGAVGLLFSAKTASGERTKSVSVDIDTIHPAIEAGLTQKDHGASLFVRPPMQVHIDAASIDATGILQIIGWAVCLVPITSVQVFIGNDLQVPAEIGRRREDVAAIHPDYPNAANSGFLIVMDVSALLIGELPVRVRAIAATGVAREVTIPLTLHQQAQSRSISETSSNALEYFCDHIEVTTVGEVSIGGWAVGAAPTEAISVWLDDVEIGRAKISLERPDVGNRFPTLPHARQAGFDFCGCGPAINAGEHLVVLRHRAGGEDTDVLLPVLASPALQVSTRTSTAVDVLNTQVLLHIDRPQIQESVGFVPIRGDLEVIGWSLARDGIASIDIAVDESIVKSTQTNNHRRDVQRAFPDWAGSEKAGFSAVIPARSLGSGRHKVSVIATPNGAGSNRREDFYVEVNEAPDTEGPWALRRRMRPAEVAFRRTPIRKGTSGARFGIFMSVACNADTVRSARTTLRSLVEQVYQDWNIWVVTPAERSNSLKADLLDGLNELDERCNVVLSDESLSASLVERQSTHVLILQPGDELGCDALLEYAAQSALQPQAEFLYADERRPSPVSGRVEAFFKPQWSPDLLLSMNYIGRAWCGRASLIGKAALPFTKLLTLNDYDLVLRLTEHATSICHVPTVLHQTLSPDCAKGHRTALKAAIERRNIEATIAGGKTAGLFRVKRRIHSRGLVSIIIPTCAARGLIKGCLESIRRITAYRRFEIVCIENIPASNREWKVFVRAHSDKVIETTEPFNWSRFNNVAVAESRGQFLLFLNDDIEIIDPSWLETLLEQAQRDEIGAVGPLLLYPDRRVQHAGMFWARLGIARHAFRYALESDPGYFGLVQAQREVIAVTGACLMTRRAVFESLGRFDESHNVVLNDVDYCLRVREHGIVWFIRRIQGLSIMSWPAVEIWVTSTT